MRLTTRLVAIFMLLSTIPLVAVAYLAFINGRTALEQLTVNRLISTNILKEAEFNRWVEDEKRSLQDVAVRPLVRQAATLLSSLDPNDPRFQSLAISIREDHFKPTFQAEGRFTEIFVLRPSDGLILVSTDRKQEGKYREREPYFLEGKKGTYVQNVYYSPSMGRSAITVGTPVKDTEGNVAAVLAGHADLTEMSRIMMQRSGLSPTEETFLVNKFNFLVTDSRFNPGSALKKAIYCTAVEDCLDHNDGFALYSDYRGVPVAGAYRWIPEYEMCIITKIDQTEALASIFALRHTIVVLGAVVLVLVTLSGIGYARTITGPLRRLLKGAEEIGRGNLEHRIEVGGRDEIGELAGEFNAMAGALAKKECELRTYAAELEQRVGERTRVVSEKMEELARSNAELEKFTYVASHDLQEPLRMVSSFVQLLARRYQGKLDCEADEFIGFAVDGAKRMQDLINDFLVYSRVETGGRPFEPTNFDSVFRKAVAGLEKLIADNHAAVTCDPLPTLRADEAQMLRVFRNLIGNAVKFRGEETPAIHISSKEMENEWVFAFHDNGMGIAKEFHERIFIIFQRLNRREDYPGTGMGLAVCRKIVERHGGRTWVESEPGKGATFYFTLPLSKEDKPVPYHRASFRMDTA